MKTPAKVHQQLVKNDSHRQALAQWFNEKRWAKVSNLLLHCAHSGGRGWTNQSLSLFQVYPILSSQDEISLRVLEFLTDPAFVDECEREGVSLSYYIESTDAETGETHRRLFNLPEQLAATQYARRKKFMEPFARQNHDLPNGGRFEFGYDQRRVETNVAQLQFMRFVVENNVLEWVRRHKDAIFAAKSRSGGESSSSQPSAAKKRRVSCVET